MKNKKGDFSEHVAICVTIPKEMFEFIEKKRRIPRGGKRMRSHVVTDILIEAAKREEFRSADEGVVL